MKKQPGIPPSDVMKRKCQCGTPTSVGSRFCSYCGQQLAFRGIRPELDAHCSAFSEGLHPKLNKFKDLTADLGPKLFQQGERVLGQFELDEFNGFTEEERLAFLSSFFDVTPTGLKTRSTEWRSHEWSYANFEVFNFVVDRTLPQYGTSMHEVTWIVLTSHRLYLFGPTGSWSIWWSNVEKVEVVREPDSEHPDIEVVTVAFSYIFDWWEHLRASDLRAQHPEEPYEGQGQFFLSMVESPAAQLFQEVNSQTSPFEDLVKFLSQVKELLE